MPFAAYLVLLYPWLISERNISRLHLYVREERKILSFYRVIDLHVTLDGVSAFKNWFWCHPFHWKFFRVLCAVHVLVDLSHQPKVWHFDSVITANQNITRCKVTMDETFLCEMILKKSNNWEHNLFIEIKIVILFSLL